jgi:hypothetical protein
MIRRPRWLRRAQAVEPAPVLVEARHLNAHDIITTHEDGRARHYCIACGVHTHGGARDRSVALPVVRAPRPDQVHARPAPQRMPLSPPGAEVTPTVLPECPNDGRPIHDGAWLCTDCGKTLRIALEHIIDLRGELEATITRQAHTRGGSVPIQTVTPDAPSVKAEPPRGSRFMEPPLVNESAAALNLAASEAATAIDNAVTTWARTLMETTGAVLPEPGRPVPGAWRSATTSWPSCPVVPTHATARAAWLLWRHVDWWRHRQEGPDLLDEMLEAEQRLTRAVDTTSRDSMRLGPCPIIWPDEEGIDRVCAGEVRAWPMPAVANLRELSEARVRLPKCLRCETEADVDWWLREMRPELSPRVTATELIGVIAYELHWTVTHEQLRQWKHREKIEAVGKDSKGRTLYDHTAVITAIRGDVEKQREKGVNA